MREEDRESKGHLRSKKRRRISKEREDKLLLMLIRQTIL